MRRYRIIRETSRPHNSSVYKVQRKKWYGWCDIKTEEDIRRTTLEFKTYYEAEEYIQSLCTDGVLTEIGCEYRYEAYTYYY